MSARKLSRREFLRLSAVGAVGAVAASCAPAATPAPAPQPTSAPAATTPPKTMIKGNLWVIQKSDFFPDMNDWFRKDITNFCKEQSWPLDITYEAGYTGGTPFLEKLSASFAAGDVADLMMHTDEILNMYRLKMLEPVDDIVSKVTAKWGDPSARQKYDFVFDKQWVAVPYFQRSDGGWYQDPAFKAKGIDVAKIRSYPDLWDACLAVSDPAKQLYGWGVTINRGGDGDWFRLRVQHGWGAYMQDETGQYVTINTPQMVEALTIMTNLYKDKKWEPMLPPGVLAWTDTGNNEAYLAGKLAYTQNGGTVYGKATLDKNPIKDITRFHPPAGGPVNLEFNSLSANYFVTMKGAKNTAAAKETMLHFLIPLESQDAIFSNAPAFALPAYANLWKESKYIPTNPVALDQQKTATHPNGNVSPGFWPGPSFSPALASGNTAGIMSDAVADILRGTAPKDAVKTAHDRYVKIFKEFKLPGEKA